MKTKIKKAVKFNGKFQVNDVVRHPDYGTVGVARVYEDGKIMTIERSDKGGWSATEHGQRFPGYVKRFGNTYWNVSGHEGFKLVKRGGKGVKPQEKRFILQYDLDSDPVESFYTMKEVKDRINELVKRRHSNHLKLDSIRVYEIKREISVKVGVKESVSIKGL